MEKRTIKENGKYYTVYCQCGAKKSTYKSPYCKPCANAKQNVRRGSIDRYLNRIETAIENRRIKKEKDLRLIEFVNRVEDRQCMVSDEELFVELIGLYNDCIHTNTSLDKLSTKEQLLSMWTALKNYKRLL